MKNNLLKNKTFLICISIWIIVTLARLIPHQPWFDESFAWQLASHFKFGHILESLKYEGHFFVWYFLLFPFAKLNLFYPYSMLFMNWLFGFGAVIVMWKYAPFKDYLKVLIMFSFPFFAYYPIIARCYAIGILLLFVLCAMYKEKTKHPIKYALVIFLCANTSVMAAIGALFFALILFYELAKQKPWKDFKYCSGIAMICVSVMAIQLARIEMINVMPKMLEGIKLGTILDVFFLPQAINLFLLVLFAIGFVVGLFKDKKALLFLAGTYATLLYFFKFWYAGEFWHYFFFYVYLICACWIGFEYNFVEIKFKKLVTVLLCCVSLLFVFDKHYKERRIYHSTSRDMANFVKEHKNDHIIFFHPVFITMLPYFGNERYDIKTSFDGNGKIGTELTFENTIKAIDVKKQNYGFIYATCAEISGFETEFLKIKFSVEQNFDNKFCAYKIDIIGKK